MAARRSACGSGHPAGGRLQGPDRSSRAESADADEFYQRITPPSLSEDERRVHRQALAGMLWSKQFYYFDLERWLSAQRATR